jgi:D-alanyl-D-alanine carboxypeptidase
MNSTSVLGRFLERITRRAALLVLAVSATVVVAQTPLNNKVEQIDQLLTAQYPSTDPGAVVLITKNGETLLRKAYGLANVEQAVALRPEDVFRIGSITKSFTAMAIMLLEEDGKLSVKDPITRFLPDFPSLDKPITLEHLLTHTSGLAVYTEMPELRQMAATATRADIINLIKNAPMASVPGQLFNYNNSGYYLLGAVVEKASGMPYADFLAKRIFSPLGMKDTAYEGQERGAKRIAGYRAQAGRYSPAPEMNTSIAFAAGALVSSADDLQRWQQAILTEKLLKPATWRRIFTPVLLNSGQATEYGYGWTIRKLRGQTMREHGGVISGFQAMSLLLPNEQLTLVFLTNQQARNNVARFMSERITAIAIGKPLPVLNPITLSEAALAEFEGVYSAPDKLPRQITRSGKQLRQQAGNSQVSMDAFSANEFFQPEVSFTRYRFEKDAAGKVARMVRIDSGDQEEIYTRTGDLPAQPAPAASK